MPDVSDDRTVREALAQYYQRAGLPPDGGASSAWFLVRIGPLRIPLPNPPFRQRAVTFHDIHHTVTGYDNVFTQGEMIIAGFEVAAGCGRVWIAWVINLWMFALGLLFVPARLFAAFVRGSHSGSLYVLGLERVKDMTVGDLKQRLRLDRPTPRPTPRVAFRFVAWSLLAWATTLFTVGLAGLLAFGTYEGIRRIV